MKPNLKSTCLLIAICTALANPSWAAAKPDPNRVLIRTSDGSLFKGSLEDKDGNLVTIKTDEATFSIRKNHGESTASATVKMPNACALPRKRAFWPLDDVSLLSQELDDATRNIVYERALAIAVALLEERSR